MKKCLALLVAAVATVAFLPNANAVVVTRNAAGDVLGGNASVNLAGTNVVGTNINIDVTALKGNAPFKIGFTMDDEGGPFPENTTYTVTVKMTNGVTPANMSLGWAMNGYDVDLIDPPGLPSANMFGPFTSTKFAAVQSNTLPSGFRFGGFNGGGGEIYNGESSTETFNVFFSTGFATGPQNFTIDFVANPEPATLLLGTLAMIPAGLVIRRRKAAADVVA